VENSNYQIHKMSHPAERIVSLLRKENYSYSQQEIVVLSKSTPLEVSKLLNGDLMNGGYICMFCMPENPNKRLYKHTYWLTHTPPDVISTGELLQIRNIIDKYI